MWPHAQQQPWISLNLVANALKPGFGLKLTSLAAAAAVGCILVARSSTHQSQRKQSWVTATSYHLATGNYPLAFLAVSPDWTEGQTVLGFIGKGNGFKLELELLCGRLTCEARVSQTSKYLSFCSDSPSSSMLCSSVKGLVLVLYDFFDSSAIPHRESPSFSSERTEEASLFLAI